MVDFVGRNTIAGEAAQWGEYWGGVDDRRQRRWTERELRDEREREHRFQLERAQGNQTAYAARAGLFESADADFSAMGRRNAPQATPNTPSGASRNVPDPGPQSNELLGGPAGGQPRVVTDVTGDSTPANTATDTPQNAPERWEPVRPNTLNAEEQRVFSAYMDMIASPAYHEAASRRMRELGLSVDHSGRLFRRTRPSAIDATGLTFPGTLPDRPEEAVPTADPTLDLDATPSSAAGLTQGPGSPFYRGDPDTSAALVPTPEMRMLEAVVQDAQRNAAIAARHGRNAEAEQHFAQALQGQAAYLQQSRLVMLRAAAQGHRTALADLLGLYSGRPEGTTQLAETGEGQNRFHIEVLTGENQWTSATSNPLTMDQLFERAEFLVDRESVAARSEANSEVIRANIAAGAQVQVAQIGALTAQQRMIVDAAIANASNETRELISQGEGDFVVDSTNGIAYYRTWERGPDGQPRERITEVSEQDVRVPDTSGNQTQRQRVGRRITGVNNVTSSGNN